MKRDKEWDLTSPKLPPQKEADIVEAGLAILRYRGFYPMRYPSGKYVTPDGKRWIHIPKGLPDYVVPQFFVEFKRPGGTPSDDQLRRIDELKIYGLETAVVDSAEAMRDWLEARQLRK